MKSKLAQLAERRAALTRQAAYQREELTEAFAPLRMPLGLVDKSISAFRYLAHKPVLMAGVVAVAVAVRPKRWLYLIEGGLMIWRLAASARRRLED
jgi:hypothetical protein